jgi:hypothetical protein
VRVDRIPHVFGATGLYDNRIVPVGFSEELKIKIM